MNKPMILSPAGSYESLCAAVSAGADEVYFGAPSFNARAFAKGFTEQELAESISLCALHGVKTNVTLNTLVTDREMPDAIAVAKNLFSMGADAFIVQDLGLAAMLKKEIPGIVLHASTQCACHNLDGAKKLAQLGFSRIVLAREMSAHDIETVTHYGLENGLFETEVFIHGALCVSHSGQCLMSSVIGARSGNRGMCAQPCRMEGCVSCGGKTAQKGYPLSLKDLSLCDHIETLCNLGIASLKIEGRMKSPEYVYRVTSVWRDLIDAGKNASPEQKKTLADIFSRGGFSDDYFTEHYRKQNKFMYGVRSESDKQKTREQTFEVPPIAPIKIDLECDFHEGKPALLTASCATKDGRTVSANAQSASPVLTATGTPMDKTALSKQLSKLGSTPFYTDDVKCNITGCGFMPASSLNALRRDAVSKLVEAMTAQNRKVQSSAESAPKDAAPPCSANRTNSRKNVIYAHSFEQALKLWEEQHPDSVILPLQLFFDAKELPDLGKMRFGVRLPRVFFNDERESIAACLLLAKKSGAAFVQASNIGQVDIALESGLELWGDVGLNVYNSASVAEYAKLGFRVICLSPELSPPQMRDISVPDGVETSVFAGGRLTLMVLESCIIKASGSCSQCAANHTGEPCGHYLDRIGKSFPIIGQHRFLKGNPLPCRNIILNSESPKITVKKGFDKVFTDYLVYESEPTNSKHRKDNQKQ